MVDGGDGAANRRRDQVPMPPRSLSESERAQVLGHLRSPRFADQTPTTVKPMQPDKDNEKHLIHIIALHPMPGYAQKPVMTREELYITAVSRRRDILEGKELYRVSASTVGSVKLSWEYQGDPLMHHTPRARDTDRATGNAVYDLFRNMPITEKDGFCVRLGTAMTARVARAGGVRGRSSVAPC